MKNTTRAATTLNWPTESTLITQYYGNGHNGTDIAPKSDKIAGDKVYAYMDGVVSKVTDPSGNPNEGYSIRIHHRSNPGTSSHARIRTQYMHLNAKPTLKEGAEVKAGDVIGSMGTSGNSTGVHLHFEVRGGSTTDFPIPGTSVYAKGTLLNSDTYLNLI